MGKKKKYIAYFREREKINHNNIFKLYIFIFKEKNSRSINLLIQIRD